MKKFNSNVLLASLLIIGLLGFFNSGFATESEKIDKAAHATLQVESKLSPIEIEGTVKQEGSELQLIAGDKTYVLEGDEILESLINRTVNVTGDLKENNAIIVRSAMALN